MLGTGWTEAAALGAAFEARPGYPGEGLSGFSMNASVTGHGL
jgi:hypothetical protein